MAEFVWQHARPKYATPLDPSARSDGYRQALIADGMGKPFMEWQRYAACVAGERTAFGNLRYEIVIVTVPRQSGKTTLVGPVQIDTVISMPNVKTFYTAQTGKDARSRFTDLVNLVKASPMAGVVKFRYSAGDEGIIFPNGSAVKIFAPTEQALHGETPPKVTLDEIWAYEEAFGDAMLEDAIIPAQMTLEGIRQVWMISTAGTALSTFMKKWVDRGRAQVIAQEAGQAGPWPKIAYIEFGLPEGGDPYDLDTIAAFHPAVGYTVTAAGLLETSKTVSRAKWLRSFCNVWTEAVNPLVDLDEWDACEALPSDYVPSWSEVTISYEVALDNECAAVVASWRDPAGRPFVRIVHAAPGTAWLVDLLVDIWTKHRPRGPLVADDAGPNRLTTMRLRKRLKDDDNKLVRTTNARELAVASGSYLDDMRKNRLVQDGSRTLRYNVANLAMKKFNDAERFSRSDSTAPIAGILAGAVGLFAYDNPEEILSKPQFRSA